MSFVLDASLTLSWFFEDEKSDYAEAVKASLPIRVDRSDPKMPALIELARTHGLTAYDAIYLHLAIEKALPIASFDRRLNDACHKAGVARFSITERDGANGPNRGT